MQYVYPCNFAPEEEGGFDVSFPDVPEALTCGKRPDGGPGDGRRRAHRRLGRIR